MTAMPCDAVRPGDVIDYQGVLHHVSRVERRAGWAWSIACDDAGWAIAVGPDVVVLPDHIRAASPSS